MSIDLLKSKLQPKTDVERVLRLMALTYAVFLMELRDQVCEKDRVRVDRAFTSASFEAMRIEPSNVEELEAGFRQRYRKYLLQGRVQ